MNEFKFGRSTPRSTGRSTPLVLTSSGQEWQWADLLADLPSVLTSSGQEWQSHIATDI